MVGITNGYKYPANAYHNDRDGKDYVRLGCFIRTIEEWEKDFNNNSNEFPPESKEWLKRRAVYEFLKRCLELV